MLTLWIDVNQCQQIGVANFVRKSKGGGAAAAIFLKGEGRR
jgi:hypothetical protein